MENASHHNPVSLTNATVIKVSKENIANKKSINARVYLVKTEPNVRILQANLFANALVGSMVQHALFQKIIVRVVPVLIMENVLWITELTRVTVQMDFSVTPQRHVLPAETSY